jgi:hypothetical protein
MWWVTAPWVSSAAARVKLPSRGGSFESLDCIQRRQLPANHDVSFSATAAVTTRLSSKRHDAKPAYRCAGKNSIEAAIRWKRMPS